MTHARKPGDVLPNGAVVLADKEVGRETDGKEKHVVLAMNPGASQPFVTWARCLGAVRLATGGFSPTDYCYAGHYFTSLADAARDYEERT